MQASARASRRRRLLDGLRRLGRGRGGSRADRRLDVADRAHDDVDRPLERVPVRLDDHGVVRGPERGHGAVAVLGVAVAELGTDRLGLVARRVQATLVDPAGRPLLHRGVEEQLEVRVGQHDGPDVAPGDDDPAAGGERALARQEGGAHLGLARDRRHRGIDLGSARGRGRVGAVEEDRRQASRAVVTERDPVGERDEAGRVVGRDPLAERGRREGAVQQPRVHEPQPEPAGRGGADAALAAGRRSVERDDDPPLDGGLRGAGSRSGRPGGRGHGPEDTRRCRPPDHRGCPWGQRIAAKPVNGSESGGAPSGSCPPDRIVGGRAVRGAFAPIRWTGRQDRAKARRDEASRATRGPRRAAAPPQRSAGGRPRSRGPRGAATRSAPGRAAGPAPRPRRTSAGAGASSPGGS